MEKSLSLLAKNYLETQKKRKEKWKYLFEIKNNS
jgi:hypothetical protein